MVIKWSKKGLAAVFIILFIIININPAFAILNNKKQCDEFNDLKARQYINSNDKTFSNIPIKLQTKIFIGCKINTFNSGRAFLFPGYLNSGENGTNVKYASGICLIGNISISGPITINGINYDNWRYIYVVMYTGFLRNYWLNLPPKPQHVFCLDGTAGLAILSYNN